jgi:ferredoxin-NADP reductase
VKVLFDHTTDETALVTTFHFLPEHPLRYRAGQYVELTLPHKNPDDRGVERSFTLSSSPTERFISITTKTNIDNPSSFTRALQNLKQGDELQVSEAKGDFVLPSNPKTPLVFVARGLGITPFRSMLTWLRDSKEVRPIHLFYEIANHDELLFDDLLKDSGVSVEVVPCELSTEMSIGRMAHRVTEVEGKPTVYIAGSDRMVISLREDLLFRGITNKRIVVDAFIRAQMESPNLLG